MYTFEAICIFLTLCVLKLHQFNQFLFFKVIKDVCCTVIPHWKKNRLLTIAVYAFETYFVDFALLSPNKRH